MPQYTVILAYPPDDEAVATYMAHASGANVAEAIADALNQMCDDNRCSDEERTDFSPEVIAVFAGHLFDIQDQRFFTEVPDDRSASVPAESDHDRLHALLMDARAALVYHASEAFKERVIADITAVDRLRFQP